MSLTEVTIHSKLAIKLWYVLRGLDCHGCGKVKTSVNYLKNILNISRATLYRYLRNDKLIRYFKSTKGELIIYLTS